MVNAWKLIFGFLIALMVLKVAYFNINENNYYWDETVYLDIAQNIHEHNGGYSSMGENFRAPLFPFLLAFFPVMGAAHLLVVLLSILSVYLAYLLGKELMGKAAGLAAALFLAINPLYYFWSYKLLTEPLTLCLIMLSLYLFIKSEHGKSLYLHVSFFFAGLAVLARYTSLSLAAALVLALMLRGRPFRRQNFIALAIFLAAISPLLVLGMALYGNPLGMLLQNSIQTSYPDMPIGAYAQNILYNFSYFVPFFFLFGILSKARKKVPSVIWLYAILTTAMLAAISQKYDRFLIILLPAYILMSAAGFTCLLKRAGKLKAMLVTIVILLSALVVYCNISDINAEKHNTEILIDATNFVKDLPCETVISNSTRHFEFFSHKNTVGYPATEEEFMSLAKEENASCFILDSFHGLPRYRKFINDTYKLTYANSSGNKFVYVYST